MMDGEDLHHNRTIECLPLKISPLTF